MNPSSAGQAVVPREIQAQLEALLAQRQAAERLGGIVNRSRPIMQGADPAAMLPPRELAAWGDAGRWTQDMAESQLNAPFGQRNQFAGGAQYGTPTGNGTGYQTGGGAMRDSAGRVVGPTRQELSDLYMDTHPEVAARIGQMQNGLAVQQAQEALMGGPVPYGNGNMGDYDPRSTRDLAGAVMADRAAAFDRSQVGPIGGPRDALSEADTGNRRDKFMREGPPPTSTVGVHNNEQSRKDRIRQSERQGLVMQDARADRYRRQGMNPLIATNQARSEVPAHQYDGTHVGTPAPSDPRLPAGGNTMANQMQQMLLMGPQYPALIAAQGRNAQQEWMRTPEGQQFAIGYAAAGAGAPMGMPGAPGGTPPTGDPRIKPAIDAWLAGGPRGPLLGTGIGEILQSEYDADSGFGGSSDSAWRQKMIDKYGLPPDMVDAFIREYSPVRNARVVAPLSPIPQSPGIWP